MRSKGVLMMERALAGDAAERKAVHWTILGPMALGQQTVRMLLIPGACSCRHRPACLGA